MSDVRLEAFKYLISKGVDASCLFNESMSTSHERVTIKRDKVYISCTDRTGNMNKRRDRLNFEKRYGRGFASCIRFGLERHLGMMIYVTINLIMFTKIMVDIINSLFAVTK